MSAAVGWEEDGVTTIIFRKKLSANGPTDHTIGNEEMHVSSPVAPHILSLLLLLSGLKQNLISDWPSCHICIFASILH